ncbi:MAG: FHIPEP family type III secretion protein, partial [Caulobacterales bacterium]|nr:FHIPEP family type III secretion protein [Caulobacterales bacterium]
EHTTLLEEVILKQTSRSTIQRVLQSLLKERVSIRDLPAILEGIAEATATTKDLTQIVEHVRARLARQLCAAHQAGDGALPVIAMSPEWEQRFAEALIGEGESRQLALAPSDLHQFVQDLRSAFDAAAHSGDLPVLLSSPQARPFVRSLVERFRPQTPVMSQNEIHARAKLRSVGQM